jgi:hypothetical protein
VASMGCTQRATNTKQKQPGRTSDSAWFALLAPPSDDVETRTRHEAGTRVRGATRSDCARQLASVYAFSRLDDEWPYPAKIRLCARVCRLARALE